MTDPRKFVGQDPELSRIPKVSFDSQFKPKPTRFKQWKSFPCIVCKTGKAWVTKKYRDRYGDNLPDCFLTCQDCKQKDRDDVAAACRNLNRRKAKMGIKKI